MDVVESSIERLNSAVELIRHLKAGELPYDAARLVLDRLETQFTFRIEKLRTRDDSITKNSRESLAALYELFDIIGFIVRSTDTRNSFELYGPLRRLVKEVVGKEFDLVLSSEWDYSPFTYPNLLQAGSDLEDIVLIGLPASETTGSLVIPLVGHELGHPIWLVNKLEDLFKPHLKSAFKNELTSEEHWPQVEALFGNQLSKSTLREREDLWSPAFDLLEAQIEEIFCDCIGLGLFRESFLLSFAHYTSPGFAQRNSNYPSIDDRVDAQISTARSYGITIPDGYKAQFQQHSSPVDIRTEIFLGVNDSVARAFHSECASVARQILEMKGAFGFSTAAMQEVFKAFKKGSPAQTVQPLTVIVNAGWKMYAEKFAPWQKSFPSIFEDPVRRNEVLSDLVYKSIEVSEIDHLVTTKALELNNVVI